MTESVPIDSSRQSGAQAVQDFSRSEALRRRAHAIIPGGAHTYAKGDDQYPLLAPGFIARGQGCRVWDVDGNSFIEYGQGIRAVGLGHGFPAVCAAARDAIGLGQNFVRPAAAEVQCAELLLSLVPGAEMVKFCKDGSDATSGAMRLARAYTGRDLVAICSDHPFFSTDDWFIGTAAMNAGVPEAVQALTVGFRYNDIESVRRVFSSHPGRIAAVILEPARIEEPDSGFLGALRDLAHAEGALFVFDEMITGFRWARGGGQEAYGIEADLACFGKAMANGFAVSALVGKREYMRLGGLDHTDRQRVFLLSTTHGAEVHSLAAASTTMCVYRDQPVIEHNYAMGRMLREGIESAAARHGISSHFEIVGRDCCLFYVARDADRQPSQAFRSLFLQETIRRGLLAPSLVTSYSHGPDEIAETIEAADGALAVYAQALEAGVERYLFGRPSESVYRKFNASSPQVALQDP